MVARWEAALVAAAVLVGVAASGVIRPTVSPRSAAGADPGRVGAVAALVDGGMGLTQGCDWRRPVDAEVVDAFRAPDHRYGSGNRGLEYQTTDGQTVVAVADGVVGFVGPVGGALWLVIDHDGGLRSSYGPLGASSVVRHQEVSAGAPVGEARPRFHLTARFGGRYLDPAPLLEGRCGRLALLPMASPEGSSAQR